MMESKVHIVTDSTAYLPAEFLAANPHVHVVPLTVNCGGQIIEDCIENNENFFAAMNELSKQGAVPTTSQPAPGCFAELFQKLLNQGCEIIAVTISSKLSGTVQSAMTAAYMVGEDKISVVDSLTTVGGLRFLVEDAAAAALEGRSREDIVAFLEKNKHRMRVLLLPDSLEHLRCGGRIGGAQALVGSLLNIRPVLYVTNNGDIEVLEKIRTQKKALNRMVEELPSNCKRAYYGHVAGEKAAISLRKLSEAKIGAEVLAEDIGPVISTHVGLGVVGLFFEIPED